MPATTRPRPCKRQSIFAPAAVRRSSFCRDISASAHLELRPGTRIVGAYGKTTLEFTGGTAFITARDADGVGLEGLVLDGGLLPLDPGKADGLVTAVNCKALVIRNVEVRRGLLNGISLDRCSGRVTDCTITHISQAGLLSRDAAGLEIAHNVVSDCGNNGIQVWREKEGEDGTIVASNRIERIEARAGGSGENGNGVNVFRAGGVLVSGNRIADCAYSAIRGNAASNIQMIANSCAKLGEVALYAEFGFEGALIANNLVDGAASGIAVTNFNEGGRLAIVQGNMIRNLVRREAEPVDKRGEGISVEADAVVTGNVDRERAERRHRRRLGQVHARRRRDAEPDPRRPHRHHGHVGSRGGRLPPQPRT